MRLDQRGDRPGCRHRPSRFWGYRLTRGIHVATGMATIPLLLMKLWSFYPNLFWFPPIRSIRHASGGSVWPFSSPRRLCR
jgi:hypothetical protein